jgi:hypothetical protein
MMGASWSGHADRRGRRAVVVGLMAAGCSLGVGGCELPMAVTVAHSPVAYTQPQAVAPLAPGVTASAPLPPFVALVTPPPAVGVTTSPLAAAGTARDEDPVVTVPGYTLPAYGSAGSRSGG